MCTCWAVALSVAPAPADRDASAEVEWFCLFRRGIATPSVGGRDPSGESSYAFLPTSRWTSAMTSSSAIWIPLSTFPSAPSKARERVPADTSLQLALMLMGPWRWTCVGKKRGRGGRTPGLECSILGVINWQTRLVPWPRTSHKRQSYFLCTSHCRAYALQVKSTSEEESNGTSRSWQV